MRVRWRMYRLSYRTGTDQCCENCRKESVMFPLTFGESGDNLMIKQVSGSEEVKKHLGDLGFVPGAVIRVISSHNGDMILDLKGTRLAVTREMATKIRTDRVEIKE